MNKLLAISIILILLGMSITTSIGTKVVNNSTLPLANGKTLFVGGSGEGNYTKIQSAINKAKDGDTVFVFNGTYYENVDVDVSINLTGEDRDTTIIDGGESGDVVAIYADSMNIGGFTIRNSGDFKNLHEYAGIGIHSNFVTITNNNISNNYRGINIDYASETPHNTIIMDNIISNNIYWGIRFYVAYNNIIKGNRISNNSGGIMLNPSDGNTIKDNIIFDNDRFGLFLWASHRNIISKNTFFNDGIYMYADNNRVEENTLNGKPIVYLEDESDELIDYEVGQVLIVNCKNITVENLNLSKTTFGIIFFKSHSCTIRNIGFFECNYGILLISCTGFTITVNNIWNNSYGIYLDNSKSNNISRNNILNNKIGVYIKNSQFNIIFNNNILKNDEGIYLYSYAYNFLEVFKDGSLNNIILKNNIFDNNLNAYIKNSFRNRWRQNFWGRPRILPKIILGIIIKEESKWMPWVNIDWRPALKPYDIRV